MTTGIPRTPSRKSLESISCAALAALMAAVLACREAPAPNSSTSPPPAPVTPPASATAPDSTATVPIAPPAAEPAPVSPAPAQTQVPPSEHPPAAAPPEPVMEWREAKPRRADESGAEAAEDGGQNHVYTNADLSRYAKPEDEKVGGEVAAARRAQEAFDKESMKKVQDQPATDAWRAKTKAEAEERVRAAEAKLEALRRLALADANPLLPQPRLASDEEKKREGLSREQRYKLTQQEIQLAEQEVAAAKANLDQILKSFAPPR